MSDVSIESTSTSGSTSGTSTSITHVVTSANKLVATVSAGDSTLANRTVSGITYNGVALSKVVASDDGNFERTEIWKLDSPASGSHSLAVTMGGAAGQLGYGVTGFIGAGTIEGAPVAVTDTDRGSPSLVAESDENEIVVGSIATDNGSGSIVPFDPGFDNQLWEVEGAGSGDSHFAAQAVPGALLTTVGWSTPLGSTSKFAAAAVAIRPSNSSTVAISAHPQSAVTNGAASVTFSVTATGSGSVTYQWYVDNTGAWTLIGGATSSSYTHNCDYSEDGARFSCVVTDTNGSTRSRSATLTVHRGAEPAWRIAIAETQWGTLPNSILSSSGVMQTSDDLIVSKWGCGVAITVGLYVGTTFMPGTFLGLFGGGHTDSTSDAVYAYGPLESDSPQFYRLRDRTSPAPTNVDQDGSGNPVSRHTYQTPQYIPGGRNWMFCSGYLFRATDAGSSGVTHTFQFNTSNPNVAQPWTTKATRPGGTGSNWSVYDQVRRKIWARQDAAGELASYDTIKDAWSSNTSKSAPSNNNGMAAFDWRRGIMMIAGISGGGLSAFRVNDPAANDYYTPTTTGTAPVTAQGILYDSAADYFVVMDASGSDKRVLSTLKAPATNPYQGGNAWTWGQIGGTGAVTPPTLTNPGPFGRFSYVSANAVRGYLYLEDATGSIYFFKPPAVPAVSATPSAPVHYEALVA